jgi:hypothetical protein
MLIFIKILLRRGVFLIVFLSFLLPADVFAAPEGEAREKPAQENSALDIRLALARAADAGTKEKLYLRLIEECPETEDAEEAYWALSALYLNDFDEAREEEARNVLERFLERYPSSLWVPHVENRLLWLRQGQSP